MRKKDLLKTIFCVLFFSAVCLLIYYFATMLRSKINRNGSVKIDKELKADILYTLDRYLSEIFDSHSIKYCGFLDLDDTYTSESNIYSKNSEYTSIREIKNYYSSIITEKYFDSFLDDKFIENNGKLYCLNSGLSNLEYDNGSVVILSIDSYADYLIVKGSYNTTENDLYSSETFYFEVLMVNSGGLWVIDSYAESN